MLSYDKGMRSDAEKTFDNNRLTDLVYEPDMHLNLAEITKLVEAFDELIDTIRLQFFYYEFEIRDKVHWSKLWHSGIDQITAVESLATTKDAKDKGDLFHYQWTAFETTLNNLTGANSVFGLKDKPIEQKHEPIVSVPKLHSLRPTGPVAEEP